VNTLPEPEPKRYNAKNPGRYNYSESFLILKQAGHFIKVKKKVYRVNNIVE